MAIFPRTVMSWNVDCLQSIDENSLRLFLLLEPKIDVLVIGTGDEEVTKEFRNRMGEIGRKYKINIELLKTESAVTTFNFLNAESRMVAGGFLPPKVFKFDDMGYFELQKRHKELYGDDVAEKKEIEQTPTKKLK